MSKIRYFYCLLAAALLVLPGCATSQSGGTRTAHNHRRQKLPPVAAGPTTPKPKVKPTPKPQVAVKPTPKPTPAPKTKPNATPRNGRYVVTATRALFYKYGPAQNFGPDFALFKGHRVTVIEQSFGYAKVMTDDGITGYVASEDLAPAAPTPIPPINPASNTASRKSRGSDPYYTGPVRKSKPPEKVEGSTPLFDVFDMPLPSDPDKPKSTDKPAPKPTPTPAPEAAKKDQPE